MRRIAAKAIALAAVQASLMPLAAGMDLNPGDFGSVSGHPSLITIVLVGDTGFNASLAPVEASFGWKHGERISVTAATANIKPLIDGDLNFANLETVVTERNNLTPVPKAYNFRTHPSAVKHLLDLGFNIFSTANNHSMDFGVEGAEETLFHIARMRRQGLLAAAGLGFTRAQALAPELLRWDNGKFRRADPILEANPLAFPKAILTPDWTSPQQWSPDALTVAFSAVGIIGASDAADEERAGQLSYRGDADFFDAARNLSDVRADYRILSVHYGQEFQTQTDERDIQKLRRRALMRDGVDLIVGHHHHVVAGVEITQGRAIFYGLGNFLHFGTRDLSGNGEGRDFGLMARVHLRVGEDGKPRLAAIEAIPLTGTHRAVRQMSPSEGARRIALLNRLSSQLDNPHDGAVGVRFAVQDDGAGLYCAPDAQFYADRLSARCRRAMSAAS